MSIIIFSIINPKILELNFGVDQLKTDFSGGVKDATSGTGADDGTAIRDALYALPNYTGVVGTFHFDANGDVVGIPYELKTFRNGKIETVKKIAVQ